jgi:acetyltransferase (GNAT) family protein
MMFEYRRLSIEDIDALCVLEGCAWGGLGAKPDEIMRRLKCSPQSVYGVFSDNSLLGSIAYVHVNADASRNKKWVEYLKFFGCSEENADCLYIVSLTAHPNAPRGVGRELLRRAKEEARARGLSYVAFGSRIPGYGAVSSHMSVNEYVQCVRDASTYDPVLSLGLLCSYRVDQVIDDFYDDWESRNFGVLLICDISE